MPKTAKGKEILLANHKEQEFFFEKKRTGKRSTRVTLSHEIRMLDSHAKKIKDPRK